MASAAVVKALVLEAIWNSVCASTRAVSPRVRTPYPLANTTRPSFTTAMAAPGVARRWRPRAA
jgi:hypothetical protein